MYPMFRTLRSACAGALQCRLSELPFLPVLHPYADPIAAAARRLARSLADRELEPNHCDFWLAVIFLPSTSMRTGSLHDVVM